MRNKRTIIVLLIVICAVISTVAYAGSNSELFSNYFKDSDKIQNQELMKEDNQSFEYDGYVISLVAHSYNALTMDGCCLFNISYDIGNKQNNGLIESDAKRFSFGVLACAGISSIPEKYNDSLNVYFYFTITDIRDEEKNKVYLYDGRDNSDLPIYEFFISDTGTSKILETKDGKIIVSELEIAIYSSEKYDIKELDVIQNDDVRRMIEKGRAKDGCYFVNGTSDKGYSYKCKTDILLDVDAVSAVNINGQIYNFN